MMTSLGDLESVCREKALECFQALATSMQSKCRTRILKHSAVEGSGMIYDNIIIYYIDIIVPFILGLTMNDTF